MRIQFIVAIGVSVASAAVAFAGCTTKTSDPYPDVASFCTAVAAAECQVADTCAIQRRQLQGAARVALQHARERRHGLGHAQVRRDQRAAVHRRAQRGLREREHQGHLRAAHGEGLAHRRVRARLLGATPPPRRPASALTTAGMEISAPISPGSTTSFVRAPEVDKPLLGFCGDPGSTCADNSYCAQQNGLFQCVASQQPGQPCSPDVPIVACVKTAYCAPGGVSGWTCAEKVTAGASCMSSDDCPDNAL